MGGHRLAPTSFYIHRNFSPPAPDLIIHPVYSAFSVIRRMYKVHFPVINIDWKKSAGSFPFTDPEEIVFLNSNFFQFARLRWCRSEGISLANGP